jgi:hypothetical protein
MAATGIPFSFYCSCGWKHKGHTDDGKGLIAEAEVANEHYQHNDSAHHRPVTFKEWKAPPAEQGDGRV